MFSSAQKDEAIDKTGKAADDVRRGASNLKADIRADLRDTANAVREDLSGLANHAGQRVRELANSAEESVLSATDSLSTNIRTKPLESVLIAAGVGFILGALFRR